MVDFAKKLEEKKKLLVVGNEREFLFATTDKLHLKLIQVLSKDRTPSKEYVYMYEYTDELGPTHVPNTKFRSVLTMSESQLDSEISKGIFKIVNKYHGTDTVGKPKKTDAPQGVGENSRSVIPVGQPQQLF